MITSEELKDLRFTKEGFYFAFSFISTFMMFLRYELSKPSTLVSPNNILSNISVSPELICPIP
jgi:hypothetical protein